MSDLPGRLFTINPYSVEPGFQNNVSAISMEGLEVSILSFQEPLGHQVGLKFQPGGGSG